jgi:Transcriptional regulatory protein, C terminal
MPSTVLATARVIQIPPPDPEDPPANPDWQPMDLPSVPVAAQGGAPLAESVPPGGTLLAVVPIPGTDSSLAIVGYTIPAAGSSPVSRPLDGGFVVDHARRCVWLDGEEIQLTYQEFELLAFLSASPAQVFSRADLLRRVWGHDPKSTTRTVDVHVSRLRRKLGPVYGPCLTTEYRVGYRFDLTPSGAA